MSSTMAIAKKEIVEKVHSSIDNPWRRLYRLSGVILVINAILSLAVAYTGRILYASGYPSSPESYLQLVAQHQQLASFSWAMWIVIDILPFPVIIAMYIILQRYNKTLAMLGSLVAIFYAIYDVAVTELNSLTLVSLSHGYALATSEAVRSSFVAAATYGYNALPIQTVLSFAIGPIAYLLWCVPMAKSFFGRWLAIAGVIVSIIGLLGSLAPIIPSSFIFVLCQFLCVRLIAIWTIFLGVQLYRNASRLPTKTVGNNLKTE
jgi:hypothetical protein